MSLATTEKPFPVPTIVAEGIEQPSFAGEPSWLLERRNAGWCAYKERPLPTRKDERWRFASLQGLSLDGFNHPTSKPDAKITASLCSRSELVPGAVRLVFADDTLIDSTPLPSEFVKKGVLFLPLAEAIARHPELLREHLFVHDRALGGEKFLGLHQACARAGAFLYVPDGVEVSVPLVVAHWASSAGTAIFPHTLIVTGANSSVNLLDYYDSADAESPALVVGASSVFAGTGARVFRKSIQNLNKHSLSFQMDNTIGGRDADVKNISVHLGAKRARFENQVTLAGPGAHLKLYALTVASGAQEFDQRTFQDHAAPRASSDLLYKNALFGESRTIFAGMIRVEPGAEETDAYQQNRNLLLDPSAEADSLPGLEIFNNNVRCTHGATTGRLDPEELFYLLSRGIPRRNAHKLLVFGFFEEVIEKVDNEALAALLRRLVAEKLEEK